MIAILKLTYRFKAKSQLPFFFFWSVFNQFDLKFVWKHKETKIAKQSWKRRTKLEDFTSLENLLVVIQIPQGSGSETVTCACRSLMGESSKEQDPWVLKEEWISRGKSLLQSTSQGILQWRESPLELPCLEVKEAWLLYLILTTHWLLASSREGLEPW